ncbi:tRNA synthetases class I, catalytic domain-containing protein [Fimicolochytrium jonesii]|uniref:tRNA synthetases class I, catalytic domain-containing protein n=1 Tax=Fimicolochytrium jonesii TaxID=1396493 RepID=UPI0022FE346B|nr:tRNA synthetases class I, catalytic domain-containing protein [Fimicolochytrium jonesii]KAI8822661.1 tRNA synthetases class I, catalytic domain-containing protein [Fimicolochytrium jonesii]
MSAPPKGNAVKAKDQGSFDIGLKDVEHGKVVTRFPPEPSGYLHIGHAKAALLNDYFARLYDGQLIVRFDDTNPSKEKTEFEESIKEDLTLLGIKPDKITYTSDSFDLLYNYALQLIQEGKAYVDDTDVTTMRTERMEGIESKCRNQSVEENLRRFDEMKNGTEFGLTCVLRAKIDYKNKNKALRDPALYRCNVEDPHHRTGRKWKIYPIYDFACPVVDSIEGVTHALRTNEYRDRNPQYEWVLKALNLRQVHIWDFSRLNFVYTLLSKRKLTWFVNEGVVTGWDDPRFPTVRGIRRRGMTIEALRQYILMQGASQKNLELEWDKIWALNKKVIDPISPRHTALNLDKITPVKVVGEDVPTTTKKMPKHKKNPDVGEKITTFSGELYLDFDDAKELVVGEEVTFMDWGNVFIDAVRWSGDKSHITQVDIKLNLQGDFKLTKKKLTWLSRAQGGEDSTPVKATLFDYDYLITKKKLEADDEVSQFVTPVSEFKTNVLGDANLRHLKKGETLQLERRGYYICDVPYDASKPDEPIHLIAIPDGRTASMVSKASEPKDATATTTAAGAATGTESKGGRERKQAREAKKEKKASAGAGSGTSKMYKVKPVYSDTISIDPTKISKMYTVKNVYGDNIDDAVTTATEKNIAKPVTALPNDDKFPAPEKQSKPKKEKPVSSTPAEGSTSPATLLSKLDIVVGKIVDVKRHPDADSLYVEQIDVGEEKPREIISGLVKFIPMEEVKGAMVLVLKNLKPISMRGIKSYGMVLCASSADHTQVEFLIPPADSTPGDKVYFDTLTDGTEPPEAVLNPKKKVWEAVQPGFRVSDDLEAGWEGRVFRTSKGVVRGKSIKGAEIK